MWLETGVIQCHDETVDVRNLANHLLSMKTYEKWDILHIISI